MKQRIRRFICSVIGHLWVIDSSRGEKQVVAAKVIKLGRYYPDKYTWIIKREILKYHMRNCDWTSAKKSALSMWSMYRCKPLYERNEYSWKTVHQHRCLLCGIPERVWR